MNNEIVKPGELYRHFKGKLYQIITIAKDAETMKELVIYQALYETFEIYARPLSEFLEVLDKNKYPDATQKYRFQLIGKEQLKLSGEDGKEDTGRTPYREIDEDRKKDFAEDNSGNAEFVETDISQKLIAFLDANSCREKIEILQSMKKDMNAVILSNMALSLDLVLENDDLESGYFLILQNLEQRCRFEGSRLR